MLGSVIVSHLSMIAGVAMTLVLVPRIIRQRRTATSTTAWLMAISAYLPFSFLAAGSSAAP
jgi:hypothetical protein